MYHFDASVIVFLHDAEAQALTTKIGLRLKAARRSQGISLQELADRTNGVLLKSRISNHEQGIRRLGLEEAQILSKALGAVSATYFLCLDDLRFLDDQEQALLRCFRGTDDRGREIILKLAKAQPKAQKGSHLGIVVACCDFSSRLLALVRGQILMQCPKCGTEQDGGNQICDHCGIVFEKYYKYHPRPGVESPKSMHLQFTEAGDQGLKQLLFPGKDMPGGRIGLVARSLLFLLLFFWGWMLMLASVESNAAGESFLHLINLTFHEAGHVFFRPFGEFMASLGGTLGQLLMPLICFVVLLARTRDPFGASVALCWLGENFLDIAPYINDARAGQLPLLGGNFGHSAPYGFHDWEFILNEIGLLHADTTIASLSHFTGSVIMLLALAWGAILLYGQLARLYGKG